jgi:hypothetical protein
VSAPRCWLAAPPSSPISLLDPVRPADHVELGEAAANARISTNKRQLSFGVTEGPSRPGCLLLLPRSFPHAPPKVGSSSANGLLHLVVRATLCSGMKSAPEVRELG